MMLELELPPLDEDADDCDRLMESADTSSHRPEESTDRDDPLQTFKSHCPEPPRKQFFTSKWTIAAVLLAIVFVLLISFDTAEIEDDQALQGVEEDKKTGKTNKTSSLFRANEMTTISGEEPSPANNKSPASNENASRRTAFWNRKKDNKQEVPEQHPRSRVYRRRGRPLDDAEKAEYAKTWGEWSFVDPKASQRPQNDFYAAYPNRDVPMDQFPNNAWQTDPDYLDQFLLEAKALVERSMEAHLAEYGYGRNDLPGEDFDTRLAKSPFWLAFADEEEERQRRRLNNFADKDPFSYGGWTTQRSFDGLVRRLLHAIMTEDRFVFVTGGHSAAAGHGNHFQQSYTLQFQRVMEPVFARLGVRHFARNIAMGGLGTIQNAMGARDLYGRDVDILLWDSGMTENSKPDIDLFARQGLMGSDRAPLLFTGSHQDVFATLSEHADADYIFYGTGIAAIPETGSPEEALKLPFAVRYIHCEPEWNIVCKENRYNGTCWIDRPDFQPPVEQKPKPGGRASWHGGNREHQLNGRILSFTVLRALHEAIELWDTQEDKILPDAAWHVTSYYDNIRSKVANLKEDIGSCYEVKEKLNPLFCKIPFQARSEFYPRANPEATSLRNIMRPFGPDSSLPMPKENIYDPPDVYNPVLGVPFGEIDYLAIVENGNDFVPVLDPEYPMAEEHGAAKRQFDSEGNGGPDPVIPGLGWGLDAKSSPNMCNGTYDSFCGRDEHNDCLLYAHNDHRGGLTFDSLSGWGVFVLKGLKHGQIHVKMDSWRGLGGNQATDGWTAINNGTDGHRQLAQAEKRKPKEKKKDFCDDMILQFAINGKITKTMNSSEILAKPHHLLVQRVVQIWPVLEDPEFVKDGPADIEFGVRLLGCGRESFWVTHIYWA